MTTRSKKVYALAGALLALLLVGAGVLVFGEIACRCPLCAIHNPFLFAGLVLAAAAWIAWTLVSIRRESVLNFGRDFLALTQKPAVFEGTTLFKSVGMALFDLVAADLIFRKAVEKGIGSTADM